MLVYQRVFGTKNQETHIRKNTKKTLDEHKSFSKCYPPSNQQPMHPKQRVRAPKKERILWNLPPIFRSYVQGIFCKKTKHLISFTYVCFQLQPPVLTLRIFLTKARASETPKKSSNLTLTANRPPPSDQVRPEKQWRCARDPARPHQVYPLVVPNIAIAAISPIFSIGNTSTQSKGPFSSQLC